ncbi:four helix bundle protein [Flavobacterium sp.]|uniref:four helix bundle protein n=1 Tax=Flavobacterium sp. TaxID=239 RepID=UPI0008C46360|nr:four helix bundle protein [Flavobacterium sp.]OGS64432.1 MAG: four helix bundle protein [Flavobacteria bacterium GWA2_35_26]HCF04426.1 four helix bundle protein [Flavobacterium sp.]
MEVKENVIIKLTFQFALDIIKYSEALQEDKKFVIANQLLKSGTSIGANIREAQNAESKADFIHKFKIAAKEIEETIYWLELCKFSNNYPKVDDLIEQVKNISRIVNKIIITSKQQ